MTAVQAETRADVLFAGMEKARARTLSLIADVSEREV